MFSIEKVEPAALEMAELAKSITKAADAVEEFELFKNSKKLNSLIIEVNKWRKRAISSTALPLRLFSAVMIKSDLI